MAMEAESKSENTVLNIQQPLHFQHERERWRKLLAENGRDFSLYGANFSIGNKTYKNVTDALKNMSANDLLLRGRSLTIF